MVKCDLGDHFRFEFGPEKVRIARPGQPDTEQATMKVTALIGAALFERFSIDVVVGCVLTGVPDVMQPSIFIEFDGLVPPNYLLYPVVDHLADKVCATFEKHGELSTPSTRSRDLVDLVVFARTHAVDAAQLKMAIEAERLHRALPRIESFVAPSGWTSGYATEASTVSECEGYRTLTSATALFGRMLDPVLSRDRPTGTWSPSQLDWQ